MSRVLIAEDEARIASFLEKGLKANRYVTEIATDGEEALWLARSGKFDLLILDLGLPGTDGFQVLRELAEVFFRHPGQVLSREQLLSHVWGYDFDPESNIVDVYVGYLRRKLGKNRITSVRGMGYRLER
jgi:DNA-binding response OmpR family regulator